MADERISVGAALQAAAALWRRALPLVWAPLAGLALLYFVAQAPLGIPLPVTLLLIVLAVPLSAIAYGALLRLALGDLHQENPDYRLGPAGLQWRGAETRLLGSILLLGLFLVLALVGAVFVSLLVSGVVAATTRTVPTAENVFLTPPGMAGAVAFGLMAAAILWSAVRLTLTTPATVDRNQIQVFSTWDMTKGLVWPLLGALVVVGLPAIVLDLGAGYLKYQAGLGAIAPIVAILASALYAMTLAFAQTPLTVGVASYFYRRTRAAEPPHNP